MSSSARPPTSRSSPPGHGGSGSSPAERPTFAAALEAVERFAAAERLFHRRTRLLVAVSGGPDSLACLHLLLALREHHGLALVVAHFDHQLRPGSADDLAFVRHHASSLGLEVITGEGPVRDVASRQRRSLEETARAMRYQFLAFAAEKESCDAVVTGHTADDHAETVLLHLLRGSGVRGVRGILPAAPLPGAPARQLLRPILPLRRTQTVAICAELGLTPRDDATNRDPSRPRNRVRAQLLPLAATFNPAIVDALSTLAESAREAFALIERRSFEAQPQERGPVGAIFPIEPLRSLPAEALLLVLEREAALFHLEPAVNRTRIRNLRAALSRGSGTVAFGDVQVEVSCGLVRIGPRLEPVEPISSTLLEVPGSRRVGPWRVDVLTAPVESTPAAPVSPIPAEQLRGALRARQPLPGDRLRWRGLDRKLSDILVNEKVPVWERHGAVVVADAAGPVAVFTARRVFAADGPPGLWVRLSQLAR